MPTVTAVRVKGMVTGALNAYIEVTQNFGSGLVEEDNILFQLNQKQ